MWTDINVKYDGSVTVISGKGNMEAREAREARTLNGDGQVNL